MATDKKPDPVNFYEGIIASYERAYQKWEGRADKIVKRYRDEQRAKQDNDQTKFNILWSNVNTLVPACYSRVPQADVGRRFRDQDPVGRVGSLLLERALTFEMEHYPDYRATMREAVLDRFLPGRGVAWARYEPHFKAGAQLPEDGLEISEDTDEAPAPEQIDYECAPVDYVHWRDFGHNVARTWEEVFCVWRIVYMFEEAVAERFGKAVASKLAYDATPEDKKKEIASGEVKKQARIYEIWDKQKGKAFWLSRSKKEMLDSRDDPLGLQEFFPCPRPLYATTTNDTLIPVPDFALYQDQARELDTLADRIDGLVRMLQVKGCYDDSVPALARLFTEGVNGTLLPVKNYAAFAEKRGLQGTIDLVDLKPIYEAIKVCFESAREIINFIYQITGISDIVRGQTEAGETLGAQQLKVNFVGLRLGDMKRDVARFATDLLQLKAQIICRHFSPSTILAMAAAEQLSPVDQQLIPEAMMLLLGEARMSDPEADSPNPLRAFRIEVNADSLIQIDEQAEKDNAKELLGGIARFLETSVQVVVAAPQMLPVILELFKWSLTKFKVGKNVEGTIDAALEQMKQAAAQPQTQKADPEMAKIQAQQQMDAQRLQHEQQLAQQTAGQEQQRMQIDAQREEKKLAQEERVAQMKIAFEEWKVERQEQTKVAIAELSAKTTRQTAQMAAASSGADVGVEDQPGPLASAAEQLSNSAKAMIEAHENMSKMHLQMAQEHAKQQAEHQTKVVAPLMQMHGQALGAMHNVMQQLAKPKKVVRDAQGRVAGVE